MNNDNFEADMSELGVMLETIDGLLRREIEQQERGDFCHSGLRELDTYIKTFETSDSLLMSTGALRYSYQASVALKNWKPLRDIVVAKWPEAVEKGVLCGLLENDK